MRRIAVMLVACLVAIAGAGAMRPGVAEASDSCPDTSITIARPTIGGGHIDNPGSSATCTPLAWFVIVTPKYESGGTWHQPGCVGNYWTGVGYGSALCEDHNLAGGGNSCPNSFVSGSSSFDDFWDSSDTASCKNAGDVDISSLIGGHSLCHYNWKVEVDIYTVGVGFTKTRYSPTVGSTC